MAEKMQAMVLHRQHAPLVLEELPLNDPGPGEILIEVAACGVCRTDLHVVDGDLTQPALPVIPGHEVIGRVLALGAGVDGFEAGQRVGVPWLGWTCGVCDFCRRGEENLCPNARFTGYTLRGGYASHMAADQRFCFTVPGDYDDSEAAPLMCAGLIGYRALRKAGEAGRLGLYGFGAAAHILAQVAHHQGREVYAFVREGDEKARDFALRLGVRWAGWSSEMAPDELDAAIIFAPVGALVPAALRAVRAGGSVVCAGIHMSEIPSFPYELLWRERRLLSVANLTRQDGDEFLRLAHQVAIEMTVERLPLGQANEALDRLRSGRLTGAAVWLPDMVS